MTKEQIIEGLLRTANRMLDTGILEGLYGHKEELLKRRRDYWESKKLEAQEKLYNIRSGDSNEG